MNRDERIKRLKDMINRIAGDLRADVRAWAEALQSADSAESIERLDAGFGDDDSEAFETLDLLQHDGDLHELSDRQLEQLEALVHERERPAIDIVDGQITIEQLTPSWIHLRDEDVRRKLEATLRSIGRIETPGHPCGYVPLSRFLYQSL
jgi:hypothetical protein